METDYLNFLKTFYQEELFLVDSIETNGPTASDKGTAIENAPEEAEAPPEKHWQSVGPLDSPLAFVLDEKTPKALPDEISERFSTMLSRLNLKTEEVLIVNREGQTGSDVEQKIKGLIASKIILLGRNGLFPNIKAENYATIQHEEKLFLLAPAFSEIIRDKTQVKMFWDAMVGFLR